MIMDYYLSFIGVNRCKDAFLTYMEQYFNDRNNNQSLGNLVLTILSKPETLLIDIDVEDNPQKQEYCPLIHTSLTFSHLKDRHYSALVPMQKFLKSHKRIEHLIIKVFSEFNSSGCTMHPTHAST